MPSRVFTFLFGSLLATLLVAARADERPPFQLPAKITDGYLKLTYVGEALSHRSGKLAMPASMLNVSVSLEFLDQALQPNDELRLSSRLPGDHPMARSLIVSAGDQTYDFNKPGDNVEISLTTDAMRRIVSWRIRASLATDNDNRYVRVFGPGYERDKELDPRAFGEEVAGSECLGSPTDIVFNRNGSVAGVDGTATRYLAQSCRPGRWQPG